MDHPAPLPLTARTLPALAARLRAPAYDRAAVRAGVVHLGVGGFARAHQAVYFDDVAALTGDWGVTGVGLRSRELVDALTAQDGLYALVERDGGGDRLRIVGSVLRARHAPTDPDGVLGALADPRTRVVTLTVTGHGYPVDVTGAFDPADPAVRADLAAPAAPRTAFGYLAEGLARRRAAGVGPFTVLSCDNVPDNGAVTRAAVLGVAAARADGLAGWIAERGAFPGSMVDRITPATTDEHRLTVARRFGVADRWPVVSEPFRQWVVEDDFCAGRPPLAEVGVELVDDVGAHRALKSRLLNGSHSALASLGLLAGHRRADAALADGVLRRYLVALMVEEVAPLLPAVPGVDVGEYCDGVLRRVANPAVADPLARLARRGSEKVPAHLLPSLREALARGRPAELLALALAGWLRALRGTDLDGRPLPVEDTRAGHLRARARAAGDDPRPLLAVRTVFGDLGESRWLVATLSRMLRQLDRCGVHRTVRAALDPAAHAAA